MPATITTAPTPPAPHLMRVGTVTIPAQPGPPALETINASPTVLPLAAPEAVPAQAPATLVRVERGSATAEEIAAVTAVLLARAATVRAAADAEHATASRRQSGARWRAHGFTGPRAWTAGTRDLLAS